MLLGLHVASPNPVRTRTQESYIVVDAGLGVPSDVSLAMEVGADAVLVNTAIAEAKDPALMAEAFRLGLEAGRKAYLAGRIAKKAYASASSPIEGVARPAAGS